VNALTKSRRRIFIFGGSNSLISDGWTATLAERGAESFDIRNRSIGAATTLMGLFRLSQASDLQPGDVAIWEYGVNDPSYASGPSTALLIENLSWFIKEASARGAHVLPVMMYSRAGALACARQGRRTAYAKAGIQLFEDCGLPFYDLFSVLVQAFGTGAAAEHAIHQLYSDTRHYRSEIPQLRQLVNWVLENAKRLASQGPAKPIEIPALEGRRLSVQLTCQNDQGESFSNSIASGRYRKAGFNLNLGKGGYLKALIVVAAPHAGAIALPDPQSKGHRYYSLATRYRVGKPRWLLKHLLFEFSEWPRRFPVGPGLTVNHVVTRARTVVQPGFCKPLSLETPHGGGIVAAILEEASANAPSIYPHSIMQSLASYFYRLRRRSLRLLRLRRL
jgi:hypothetical protein